MARAAKKPRSLKLDRVTVRAIRGPHTENPSHWYWRAEHYEPGVGRTTVWTGWGTREEARRAVSQLLVAEDIHEAADAERARQGDDVRTVQDLLEVFLGDQQLRVELWRLENQRGEEAVRAGRARRVRFSRDALAPSTYASMRSSARQIVKGLGSVPLSRLGQEHLRHFVSAQMESYAPGTVRKQQEVLKGAWAWGAREGRTFSSGRMISWLAIAETPVRDKFTPTREQMTAVLDAMDPGWARDVLTVQSVLGCRIGALARLTHADYAPDAGTLRLRCKRHDRTISVPEHVQDVLSAYHEPNLGPAAPLWGVSKGTILGVANKANSGHSTPWTRACEAAGVPRFTTHGIRRLVSTEWIRRGVNLAVYSQVLGHSPEQALRAYAEVSREDQLAAFGPPAASKGA